MSGSGRQGQGQALFLGLFHFLFIQSKMMSELAVEWEFWRSASAIRFRGLRDAFALSFINVKDRPGQRWSQSRRTFVFLPFWSFASLACAARSNPPQLTLPL
ncbi:hypothetical protein V6N13_053120 [Hibiscus sabdariffa]|uniref:Secreted protein n=1 Tax=Hibiscus sabdariffa TaxID=183260 RepID=A0ABR2Q6M0_9ROSI